MSDKIYEFRKVEDFLQLTEEQFNRFLPDFIHWFAIRKTFIQKKQVALEELGVFVQVNPEPVIKWKDGKIGVDSYEVTIRHHQHGENDVKIKVRKEK